MNINGFPSGLVKLWEKEGCLNFAIALERLTGWLLHIDWLHEGTSPDDNIKEDQMFFLRAYVADNGDGIFDVRGITDIKQFAETIIYPIAESVFTKNRSLGQVGVATRFYDEEKMKTLRISRKIEEKKIVKAMQTITQNSSFLNTIPVRQKPLIPAYKAATFTYGRCQAYAQALEDIVGIQATALIALEFKPMFAGTSCGQGGYLHSLCLHDDGIGEDSWGMQSVDLIAERFGLVKYRLDVEEHKETIENVRRNTPELYREAYQEAKRLIKEYR